MTINQSIKQAIVCFITILMVFIIATIGANAQTEEVHNSIWYVNADSGLNCRREPKIEDNNIITAYTKGTALQALKYDDSGQWLNVWDGRVYGWCYAQYLLEQQAENQDESVETKLEEQEESKGKYIGNFRITGYTPAPSENGGSTVTALGDKLRNSVGHVIAVDPKVIPLNSKVYIKGIGYRVARDVGGAIKGKKIDVLTYSNAESLAITGSYDVYLVE